jgi:membrane fusion protein (multidrug efflux system)
MSLRGLIGTLVLFGALGGAAGGLYLWKKKQTEAAAHAPAWEPSEKITAAKAREQSHRRSTTAIGTVLALRSVTLRNELAGTVRQVSLASGKVVEEGETLVQLDIAVEQAELKAQEAQAALAETSLARMEKAVKNQAASELELDRAKAERDVALAQVARTRAVIARKTIRAPFKARVGIADVHPGQYLNEGTILTTLQGVDEASHIDFTVAQRVAETLKPGDVVEVVAGTTTSAARIVAIDARIDPATRTGTIRAKVDGANGHAPGASVRVRIPVGPPVPAVAVPVSALRKGPSGDHVFVIQADAKGDLRASPRAVEVGAMVGDEILIVSGLKAGEQVAASGSFKLRDGLKVDVTPPPAAARPVPSLAH